MRDPVERTKVVVRRLPPAISQSSLIEQIDVKFGGRYNWFCFRPGKNSQKNLRFSRAYIDFQNPDDVVEFAELFNGHVFVNEKGIQYKAVVEYAPSQRVPRPSKKDGREGTIFKDPEYLSFLEHISKPVENLPSAEIQLERKEAEKAGASKEVVIVTPLMEFIRQKRASKGSSHKSSANGKSSRRSGGGSGGSQSSKRSSEKKKQSSSVYILRDGSKGKDKPRTILIPRREEAAMKDTSNVETGAMVTVESGKKKLVLLKGKDRDTLDASPAPVSNTSRQSQRNSGSSKIIRSILSKQTTTSNSDQPLQPSISEKDKRPPRHPNSRVGPGSSQVHDPSASHSEKKIDVQSGKNLEGRVAGSGRGSHKQMGRRGPAHGSREVDGSSAYSEPKASTKRGPVSYGSQEKQVWVQKSGAGS